jgi:AraC family ethanolamine operon transcriptional activator
MNPLHFTDFDEYASAIRDVDLDVRLIHPQRQQHRWSLQEIELQSLRLQFAVEGSGILAFGKMHRDGWGLYFQLSGMPVCVNGKRIGPGKIAILPPNAEFGIAGHGAVSWFSVFAPGQLLDGDAESKNRSSSVYVPQGKSQELKRLYSQVRKVQRCSARLGLSSLHSPGFALLQDDLLSTVCNVLWSGETSRAKGSTPNSRRLTAQAVELIHDYQGLKMSVRDLAVILDVSERTLEYAFRDQFDISPQAFLINYRLHQARKSLQSSGLGETTVAMVAAENGFFDFGRFAAKYLQLFGEHPSATLRRPN